MLFYSKQFFLVFELVAKIPLQLFFLHVFSARHAEMQHWIFCPLLLQLLNGKSFKQFFLALEIAFESGRERSLN